MHTHLVHPPEHREIPFLRYCPRSASPFSVASGWNPDCVAPGAGGKYTDPFPNREEKSMDPAGPKSQPPSTARRRTTRSKDDPAKEGGAREEAESGSRWSTRHPEVHYTTLNALKLRVFYAHYIHFTMIISRHSITHLRGTTRRRSGASARRRSGTSWSASRRTRSRRRLGARPRRGSCWRRFRTLLHGRSVLALMI